MRVSELLSYDRGRPVNRQYFMGDDAQPGFLKDFFAPLRELGHTRLTDSVPARLDRDGTLPLGECIRALADLPASALKSLSGMHREMDVEREGSIPQHYRHLAVYFDPSKHNGANRGEAGRFILLFSQACSLLHQLKQLVVNEGGSILRSFQAFIDDLVHKGKTFSHSFHELQSRYMNRLLRALKVKEFSFEEQREFLQQVREKQEMHLGRMIVSARQRWEESHQPFQEARLYLQLACDWRAMEDAQGPSRWMDNGAFRSHLQTFHKDLGHKLAMMEAFGQRVQKQLEEGGHLNGQVRSLLDGIVDLLDACHRIGQLVPFETRKRLRSASSNLRRLRARLHRHIAEEQSPWFEKVGEEITRRFAYVEEELVNVMLRGNPLEIRSMGRTFPILQRRMQNEPGAEALGPEIRKRLEATISSSGRLFAPGLRG